MSRPSTLDSRSDRASAIADDREVSEVGNDADEGNDDDGSKGAAESAVWGRFTPVNRPLLGFTKACGLADWSASLRPFL